MTLHGPSTLGPWPCYSADPSEPLGCPCPLSQPLLCWKDRLPNPTALLVPVGLDRGPSLWARNTLILVILNTLGTTAQQLQGALQEPGAQSSGV